MKQLGGCVNVKIIFVVGELANNGDVVVDLFELADAKRWWYRRELKSSDDVGEKAIKLENREAK